MNDACCRSPPASHSSRTGRSTARRTGWTPSGDFAGSGGLGPIGQSRPAGSPASTAAGFSTPSTSARRPGHRWRLRHRHLSRTAFTSAKDFDQRAGRRRPHRGDRGTTVDLIVDGERSTDFATGDFSGILDWTSWDVAEYVGQEAHSGFSDNEHQRQLGPYLRRPHRVRRRGFHADPAQPDSGQSDRRRRAGRHRKRELQRRSSTGRAGTSRSTSAKRRRSRSSDYNTGAWGHINLDAITFADERPPTSEFLADWIDYGADHYATISWHNLPEGDGPTRSAG